MRGRVTKNPTVPLTWHAFVCATLLAAHIIPALMMRAPAALYDEFTYLGFARFFAGVADLPSEPTGAYGAPGYSFLIAPAFWFFKSFTPTYHTVLVLNSLFLTACYPMLYVIARRHLGRSPAVSAMAAFIAALYPSFLLISNYAVTENAYIPVFLLYCLVSLRFIDDPNVSRAAQFGILTAVLYMFHSRSLGLIVSTLFLHAVMLWLRRTTWRLIAVFYLAASPVILASRVVATRLMQGTGLTEVLISRTVQQILSVRGFTHAVVAFAGEWMNLTISSAGLCIFGLLWAIDHVRKHSAQDAPERRTCLAVAFWTVSVVCVAAVSALFLSAYDPTLTRPDFLANGRYPEGTVAILILFGAIWLLEPSTRIIAVRYSVTAIVVIAVSTLIVAPMWTNIRWLEGPGPRIGLLALMGVMRIAASVSLVPAAVLGTVFLCLLVTVARFQRLVSGAVLCAAFIASASVEFATDLVTQQRIYAQACGTLNSSNPLLLIGTLDTLPRGARIGYDMDSWNPNIDAYYQLWAQDKHFIMFDSATPAPPAEVVIAGRYWHSPRSYRQVACEVTADACLYGTPNSFGGANPRGVKRAGF